VIECDRPDAQLARGAVEEVERGEPGGLHPRGRDVVGLHRARDVGGEHYRGALLWNRDGGLGPRQRDRQRGQRDPVQHERQVAPEAGLDGRDGGEQAR
jgi:hypothetical protein